MEKGVFEKQLEQLVREIQSIPASQREKIISLARQTYNCHKQLRKSVGSLQESLDYLRVGVKYLVFDLEATRRENEYLKKLVDDSNT
jgi:hypothetical protein